MPFNKGQSGNPAGKPPGPNKATKALKEMVLGALDDAGGQEYLMRQAEENPTAFLSLVGKVLPLQVTGDGGGPVLVVTGVRRAGDTD